MSSIAGTLSIARSAMQAAQAALQTTSQNIANAGVEGYTVQRVNVAAAHPVNYTYGNVGTGVVVQGITQARDRLLDTQFRAATGSASYQKATNSTLSRVEQVFGEPSSTGLANSLDQFWNSWSDLSTDPTSLAARGVVRQRGNEVAGMLNGFAAQLDSIATGTRTSLALDIGKVNQLATQVAQMAPAIVAAEAGGQSANDLRDARNRLLDQMSSLVNVQVIDRADGAVGVYLGGRTLVDGTSAHQVTMSGTQPIVLTFAGETSALPPVGGRIGAAVTSLDTQIPGVIRDLDTLAGTLVRQTNAIHTTGVTFTAAAPGGTPAGNFFDQDPTITGSADPFQTARGIRVSAAMANVANIAAAGAGATGVGNGDVANRLAALRDTSFSLPSASGAMVSGSMGAFYRYTVTDVALATSQSASQSQVQDTLVSQADTRRQSVSGVSTDEELVNMIKQQQAYQAAAKLIGVIDEMTQTLINLGK